MVTRVQALGKPRRQQLETTYFDTPEGELAQRRAALRLRRQGRQYGLALKTGDAEQALATRGEYEVPLKRAELDIPALLAAGAPEWLRDLESAGLQARFLTRFERLTVEVSGPAGLVEIALDHGVIEAGTGKILRREPIREIEFELKGGEPELLFQTALALQSATPALPLLPLPASKALRGERLARVEAANQVLSASREVFSLADQVDTAAELLRRVAAVTANIVAANLHALSGPDTSLAIHQARVALRRLRSAVRLLRDEADFPQPLTTALARLATALGRARDLDVLVHTTWPQIERYLAAQDRTGEMVAAATALEQELRAAMQTAREEAQQLAADPSTASCLIELMAYACHKPTAKSKALTDKKATQLVEGRCRRLLKAAKGFAKLEPEAQHRVRILGKRARYAAELLDARLPGKPAARLTRLLTRLQDRLGLLNDAEVALPYILPKVEDLALAKALLDWRSSLRDAYVDEADRELRAIKAEWERLRD